MLVDGVPDIDGAGLDAGLLLRSGQQVVVAADGQDVGPHLGGIADVGGKLGQAGDLAHHAVRGFLPVVGHLYRQHAPWRQLGEQAGYQRFMLLHPLEGGIGINQVGSALAGAGVQEAMSASAKRASGRCWRAVASIAWELSIPVIVAPA